MNDTTITRTQNRCCAKPSAESIILCISEEDRRGSSNTNIVSVGSIYDDCE